MSEKKVLPSNLVQHKAANIFLHLVFTYITATMHLLKRNFVLLQY